MQIKHLGPGVYKSQLDSTVAAQKAAYDAWKAALAPAVAVDLLKHFQYAGFVDRPDGGGTVRSWDTSGALLISSAVGGHGLHPKRSITVTPGIYSVSISAVVLTEAHAWTNTIAANKGQPITAQIMAYALNADGTERANLGSATMVSKDFKGAEGGTKSSPSFVVTEPTIIRPILITNGWEGDLQLAITTLSLCRMA